VKDDENGLLRIRKCLTVYVRIVVPEVCENGLLHIRKCLTVYVRVVVPEVCTADPKGPEDKYL
jgi:hypothetical protein